MNRRRITNSLIEITIVVIGVLIAVSINNFKENLNNARYIKSTFYVIKNEIENNQLEIEKVLKRHESFADSIKISAFNEEEVLAELISRLGGIQSARVKNIGLDYFISNKANLVDYKIIYQLSDIELTTKLLEKKIEYLTVYTMDALEKKDSISKKKLLIHLLNVIDSEKTLLHLYTELTKNDKIFLED